MKRVLEDGENSQPAKVHKGDSSGLQELLDLTSVSGDQDISSRFDAIARSLLHDYRLCVELDGKKTAFELLEIEFYLRKEGHYDPFCHGTDEQNTSGKWYFHRAPTYASGATADSAPTAAGGYRGGSRKGMDITFGGPISTAQTDSTTSTIRGGILFRSIRRTSDSVVISGPSLLVDEILRLTKAQTIAGLVVDKWAKKTNAFPVEGSAVSLFLAPSTTSSKFFGSTSVEPVYQSPRIGLELSHSSVKCSPTDPRVLFVARRYRYFIHPQILVANGRSQTFIGVYYQLREKFADGQRKALCNRIANLTGIKEPSVETYLSHYETGLSQGKLSAFVGPAGKGAASSVGTYLKMMGALDKFMLEARSSEGEGIATATGS